MADRGVARRVGALRLGAVDALRGIGKPPAAGLDGRLRQAERRRQGTNSRTVYASGAHAGGGADGLDFWLSEAAAAPPGRDITALRYGTKVTILLTSMRVRRIAVVQGALLLTAAGAMAANGAAGSPGAKTESAGAGSQAGHHAEHARDDDDDDDTVSVVLRDVSGRSVGRVSLREANDIVVVEGSARRLTPGFHGFHVHETGRCEANAPSGPFTTAGGHFTGGISTTHGDHAGDMPSLLVTQNGRAFSMFVTDRFELDDLRDADGSAVIVHEARDNFANIPTRYVANGVAGPDATTRMTGDAGARVACGVIR
jgi:Cu-Zn family superoxide dismutase